MSEFINKTRQLRTWDLYSDVHKYLLKRGWLKNNGLDDLLGALSSWVSLNTDTLYADVTVRKDSFERNQKACLEIAKLRIARELVDKLMEKDFLKIIDKDYVMIASFEAQFIKPVGHEYRVPLMEPIQSLIEGAP